MGAIQKQIAVLTCVSLLVGTAEVFSFYDYRFEGTFWLLCFLATALIFGYPTLLKGLKSLLRLQFGNINLLMTIAFLGAFTLGEYPEGTIVILLFTLAELLESFGIMKSRKALENLAALIPKTAYLKKEAKEVAVHELKVGDVVVVFPDRAIPADGQVILGVSAVDESAITGEPFPKDKTAGDLVFAGTFNLKGLLEMEVSRTEQESAIEKIRRITLSAMEKKAIAERFIERFARIYTPLILCMSLAVFAFSSLYLKWPLALAIKQALVLLVISCPCALVISTPIAFFSSIGNATRSGILIKGGKWLEALASVNAFLFDKTKTLTKGKPKVAAVIPMNGTSREQLLACAAGLESYSSHPIAESIMRLAKDEGFSPHPVEKFEQILGRGVKADCLICGDRHHCIGKLQFILEEHHVPPDVIEMIDSLERQGNSVIVLSSFREVRGILAFQDEMRESSRECINELKAMGIVPVLVTGDTQREAERVADSLGIKKVIAEALPDQKARVVEEAIREFGKVGMVGDGINDAPALALSDVGISFSQNASEIAKEAASIIILSDRLQLLPELIKLGRATVATIRFNTALAIATKATVLAFALAGFASLPLAIFADVGITLIVIALSLRLFNWRSDKKAGSARIG
ncbi:heavy metal translocating P-type ATPase [Estrella lausannensis]|uniref:P-type Zn(2+) transporter n=1 Tax=Estrella lausannensis TaxID=483423 RepID=A0A0H5DP96_9BACT|nr:cation-translocating P-type ATPase [Estrella lausannensis]CRX38212.1 cadmium-transporting ATPase [Estrella lausannensis]